MKASIRVNSLLLSGSGPKTLGTMEKHGKRLDGTSQARKVRDVPPLVYGGLNLRELYDEHVEDCKMNKALRRPVLHALIQYPAELPVSERNEKAMLNHAIKFINDSHGGEAVFAARLDRDEKGQHVVDVFYSPRFEKHNKKQNITQKWVSTTKFGKALCQKHRDEIERRHDGHFIDGPRQVGIALQEELHQSLTDKGLHLDERKEKDYYQADRLEPEMYRIKDLENREKAVIAAEANVKKKQRSIDRSSIQAKTAERRRRVAQDRVRAAKRRRDERNALKVSQKAPEAVSEPRELSSREIYEQKQQATEQRMIKRIVESKLREIDRRNDQDDEPEITRSPSM